MRKDQSVGDLDARQQKEIDLSEVSGSADTEKFIGDKIIAACGPVADGIRGATKGRRELIETGGKVVGGVG